MANKVTSFQVQNKDYHVDPDLTFDGFPTEGSSNPVTSNGIFVALQGAVIGDNISYGRTTGSPVGYCSISYGKNNIASSDYCIVFGSYNTGIGSLSIMAGNGNTTYGHSNAVFGTSNTVNGYYSSAFGDGNVIGHTLKDSTINISRAENNIYIGYINLSTKKVYSDETMQTPVNIPLENRYTCYVLDLTNNTNQHIGDVYEYYRNGSSYTLTPIINNAVRLTNICDSIGYIYCGPAYYKTSDGSLYSDAGQTTKITPVKYRDGFISLYFDVNSHEFVSGIGVIGLRYRGPDWAKVKVYKAGYVSEDRNQGRFVGRYAYVSKSNNQYRVYTSPDFEESTEITNDLYDGEVVVDYGGDNEFQYFFDSSHNYLGAVNSSWAYSGQYTPTKTNCTMILGTANTYFGASSGPGGLISGNANNVGGTWQGAAIFGVTCSIYSPGNSRGNLITGYSNRLYSGTSVDGIFICGTYNSVHTSFMLGGAGGNAANVGTFVSGQQNTITGYTSYINTICGSSNTVMHCDTTSIIGSDNYARHTQHNLINGWYNNLGDLAGGQFTKIDVLTQNSSGIYEARGVSYDASTGLYTYPTDTIFMMNQWQPNGYHCQPSFVGYYVSTDTHNLTPFSPIIKRTYCSITGSYNNYFRKISTIADTNDNSQYCYILGAYNSIYARNMTAIGAIGYNLKVNYPNDNAPDGAIFLGAYNSMGETTNAQVVIGIGTSESERSNGFVVYKNGITAAPACPNTVSAASSAAAADGIDAGKVLVSYAMLQDYTSPGGGGSSRPTVTVLNLEAANWSNEELTESLPNITENSIVIIQPSGNPHAFYTDEIYLKSQGEGEVTFGCSVVPSVDITVKVVYWV